MLLAAILMFPATVTEPVRNDSDDPAVWVHATKPERSLILGTNKKDGDGGALVVFGLDGKIQRTISGIHRPNNVDVEYGFPLGGRRVDLAVVTERGRTRLRIFAIDPSGKLSDVTGNTQLFVNDQGSEREPMGVGLYRDAKTGNIDAIVSRKSGPSQGYLGRFRLVARGGKVDVRDLGRLGSFSGDGEIESLVVDDATQTVYYSDELHGIRSVRLDGSRARVFGRGIYRGDREGLAMLDGHLMSTDQIKGGSRLLAYHVNSTDEPLTVFNTGADDTDGIDICARPLGPRYPEGIFVAMNSRGKNFWIYDLRTLKKALPK